MLPGPGATHARTCANIRSTGVADREFIGKHIEIDDSILKSTEHRRFCFCRLYGTWEAPGGCKILPRSVGTICRRACVISELCCYYNCLFDDGVVYVRHRSHLVCLSQSSGTKLTVDRAKILGFQGR